MTDKEFTKMVKEALDNWDFDENADVKQKLEGYLSNPSGLGDYFETNFLGLSDDKWDDLWEMAVTHQ